MAVVSWNTRELLMGCLRSLSGDVDAGRADVWVVDNGSSDGSPEMVREQAPWATLVEPGENLGFGPAVDLVAERTQSPWLACANSDIALAPDALATMLRAGERASAGIVAPRLLLPDGTTQHSVHSFPDLRFSLLFNLGLHHLSRDVAERLCLAGFWDPTRRRWVPWAVGAFLLIRRAGFERAGRFDATQWMYAEDLDLGWRMAEAGHRTLYEPAAVVEHHESAATNEAFGPDKRSRFMAATYDVLARRRGRAYSMTVAAVNMAGALVRSVTQPQRARRVQLRKWARVHAEGLLPRQRSTHSPRSRS